MPLPSPRDLLDQTREYPAESGSNGAAEAEPERERECAPAREDRTAEPRREVVPLHSVEATERGWRAASRAWTQDARETGNAALDNALWCSRPPSLRDMHTRIQRADWAGSVPLLKVTGQAFGYLSLTMTAAGYGLLWITARPTRLAVATLVVLLIVT